MKPRQSCHAALWGLCANHPHRLACSTATYNVWVRLRQAKLLRVQYPLPAVLRAADKEIYALLCDTIGQGLCVPRNPETLLLGTGREGWMGGGGSFP